MTGYWGGVVWGLGAGVLVGISTILGVWGERKVAGHIQKRYGPNTAPVFGIFQLVYDLLKLLTKEDIHPKQARRGLFNIAPLFMTTPIISSLVIIPFAAGWAPLDTSIGILFFLAVPSISVLGVLFAGWSQRNTYASLGGLRGAAQMISYEVPRSLSVLAVVMLAGTMQPVTLMGEWRIWWLPVTLIAFVVYFIASIAELNRGPFDLAECDSELVGGYFTDYSGIRWAMFMMSEYGGMTAAALFGSVVFLGGTWPLSGVLGVLVLLVKTVLLVIAFMWAKWTFPRMRPDQLMATSWKVLTPMALVQIVIVGVVIAWL
ncbi:MAG: NADH-quinone oxidoreductase subunit NuoH [Actinomycetia bacterium]|nr:NADH-quinone oxidoreductase subunit NuoH [Actinomycetes bacterium]